MNAQTAFINDRFKTLFFIVKFVSIKFSLYFMDLQYMSLKKENIKLALYDVVVTIT